MIRKAKLLPGCIPCRLEFLWGRCYYLSVITHVVPMNEEVSLSKRNLPKRLSIVHIHLIATVSNRTKSTRLFDCLAELSVDDEPGSKNCESATCSSVQAPTGFPTYCFLFVTIVIRSLFSRRSFCELPATVESISLPTLGEWRKYAPEHSGGGYG